MTENNKNSFPDKWNDKMGISQEDFAYLQDNLNKAYVFCVSVNCSRNTNTVMAYQAPSDLGIYGNACRLIEQKKNILKDATPEQILLAYTRFAMSEAPKVGVGDNLTQSVNYGELVSIGKCLLSGELPTDEIACKIGNLLLNNSPDGVQKKLDEIRQHTFPRAIKAKGPFICGHTEFKRGEKKPIPRVDVESPIITLDKGGKGGNDGIS